MCLYLSDMTASLIIRHMLIVWSLQSNKICVKSETLYSVPKNPFFKYHAGRKCLLWKYKGCQKGEFLMSFIDCIADRAIFVYLVMSGHFGLFIFFLFFIVVFLFSLNRKHNTKLIFFDDIERCVCSDVSTLRVISHLCTTITHSLVIKHKTGRYF